MLLNFFDSPAHHYLYHLFHFYFRVHSIHQHSRAYLFTQFKLRNYLNRTQHSNKPECITSHLILRINIVASHFYALAQKSVKYINCVVAVRLDSSQIFLDIYYLTSLPCVTQSGVLKKYIKKNTTIIMTIGFFFFF